MGLDDDGSGQGNAAPAPESHAFIIVFHRAAEPSTRPREGRRRRPLPRRPQHPQAAAARTTLAATDGSAPAVPPALPAGGSGQGSAAPVLDAHAFIAILHRPADAKAAAGALRHADPNNDQRRG